MFLIDVACPRGSLSEHDRRGLADDVCEVLVGAEEGASAATMRRARAMTHVGFRELESWTTGDGPWSPGKVPPLWVTLTVPEAWRAEMSRTAIGAVRRGVRRLDRAHEWQREEGDLWVNIVGIADGSIGMDGKPSTADQVVGHMTAAFRAQDEAEERADLPDGVVIDPMCGMHVRLVSGALTLEHDGRTFGFCAAACRAAYAREHGLPVPS
jgi:YHS domain-containing protein